MSIKKTGLFIILVLSFTLGALYLFVQPQPVKELPDISVHTIEGNTINFSSLRGTSVLVIFWASSCRSCLLEIPHLIDLYHDLNKVGLEIVGIAMSYDPPNQVVALAEQENIPYPVALDIDGRAAEAFGGISLTPSSFLIDKDGNIVQHELGIIDFDDLRIKLKKLLEIEDVIASKLISKKYHALV